MSVCLNQGFRFCSGEGDEGEEKAEKQRRKKAAEALEDELLPEQRWPFLSSRRKVLPKPPPDCSDPCIHVSDTRANQLRAKFVRKNKKKGKYASGEER